MGTSPVARRLASHAAAWLRSRLGRSTAQVAAPRRLGPLGPLGPSVIPLFWLVYRYRCIYIYILYNVDISWYIMIIHDYNQWYHDYIMIIINDYVMIMSWSQCLKIPLSFHYTGRLIGIPLLDYYNPQYILGSIIPELIINQHQPEVLNTAQLLASRGIQI